MGGIWRLYEQNLKSLTWLLGSWCVDIWYVPVLFLGAVDRNIFRSIASKTNQIENLSMCLLYFNDLITVRCTCISMLASLISTNKAWDSLEWSVLTCLENLFLCWTWWITTDAPNSQWVISPDLFFSVYSACLCVTALKPSIWALLSANQTLDYNIIVTIVQWTGRSLFKSRLCYTAVLGLGYYSDADFRTHEIKPWKTKKRDAKSFLMHLYVTLWGLDVYFWDQKCPETSHVPSVLHESQPGGDWNSQIVSKKTI